MTASKQPQHCDHECVCGRFQQTACVHMKPCPAGSDIYENCDHDTRASHSSQPVPDALSKENITISAVCGYEAGLEAGAKAERERVLKEAIQRIDENVGAMEDSVVEMQNLRTINHTMNKIESFREIIGILESLRGGEQR